MMKGEGSRGKEIQDGEKVRGREDEIKDDKETIGD